MKRIFFILLMLSSFAADCQNKKVDSLLQLLTESKQDTSHAKLLNLIGVTYKEQGNYTAALKYLTEGIAFCSAKDDKKNLANLYSNIGTVYRNQNNYERAVESQLQALQLQEALGNKIEVANIYNNLGATYYSQHNDEKALSYYTKSIDLYTQLNHQLGMSSSYNNIGNLYFHEKKYEQAIDYYTKSLTIAKQINNPDGIAKAFNNLANVYGEQGKLNLALDHHLQGLQLRESISDLKGISTSCFNIAEDYGNLKKLDSAKFYLQKALDISKQLDSKEDIADAYESLSDINIQQKDFEKAIDNYKKSVVYRDSVFNKKSTERIVRAEMNYDFEKKEALAAVEARKRKIEYLSAIILLALLAFAAFLLVNRQRLKAKKDKTIFQQQEALLLSEKKRVEEELLNAEKQLSVYTENIKQKNDLIDVVRNELELLKNNQPSTTIDIERVEHFDKLMQSTILTDKEWDEFRILFEKVHKGFFLNLKEILPNLTETDTRMLCLIKLQLSNREMANMLGVSIDAIKKSKQRLRKKTILPDDDKELEDIIANI
jgi:tetratricopeptide (TPR) repeat protein